MGSCGRVVIGCRRRRSIFLKKKKKYSTRRTTSGLSCEFFREFRLLGFFTSFTGNPQIVAILEISLFIWQKTDQPKNLSWLTATVRSPSPLSAGSHPRCHWCCSLHHHVSDLRDPRSRGRRPHRRRGQSLSYNRSHASSLLLLSSAFFCVKYTAVLSHMLSKDTLMKSTQLPHLDSSFITSLLPVLCFHVHP